MLLQDSEMFKHLSGDRSAAEIGVNGKLLRAITEVRKK